MWLIRLVEYRAAARCLSNSCLVQPWLSLPYIGHTGHQRFCKMRIPNLFMSFSTSRV
ncbi:unnamed protein product [Rhodiola kirilowii]